MKVDKAALIGLVLAAGAALLMRSRLPAALAIRRERRSDPDPESLRAGAKGESPRVGFDIGRLESVKQANYKPVVQYLSYIQVQRGAGESLIFVRNRDLDALASLAGVTRDDFVDEFKKMGVLLSMN